MKPVLALLLFSSPLGGLMAQTASAPAASAPPTIVLKNGLSQPAVQIERQDDRVMVTVTTPSGGKGQVAYNVSDISELKMPPPPELATAAALIANGHAREALELLQPILAFEQSLRDIPGNYWDKTALTQSYALANVNQTAESESLLKDIIKSSSNPEMQLAAKLQLSLESPPKDAGEALTDYDTIISKSSDAATLTRAWMAEGDIHFSQHEFADAVLNYLSVVVFYPDQNPVLPKALWGAALSYGKLKDTVDQEKTWHELMTNYPDSPEATLAKTESIKKEK